MQHRGLSFLVLLIGCDGATTISKNNDEPVAKIDDPADGSTVQAGSTVTFSGTVLDDDDDAETLVATWFSGAEVLCAEAPVGADGATVCEVEIGLGDTEITLEGRDPDNAAGVASVRLSVLGAGHPEAQLLTPDGTGPYYSDHAVGFTGLVSDPEQGAETLAVAWTDEAGAALDIDGTPEADGSLSGVSPFDTGDHAVMLTVTDSDGQTDSALAVFRVGGPNTLPTCEITAPAADIGSAQGWTVDFSGLVTDPDVDSARLTGAWSSDIDGPLASGAPDSDGNVAFSTDALTPGLHSITLTGTDEVGGACTDTVIVDVSAPPDIDIDLPTDGDVYNEDATVTFNATVSDDNTAPEALTLSWSSDIDGVLDTTPADATGLATFEAGWLSIGTHTLTLTATDSIGLVASASVVFTINGLPTTPTVGIDPADPLTADDLIATVTGASTDPDGDPITYSYAWYVDGTLSVWTTDTVPAAATARGEVWEVYVTPTDGYGSGPSGVASVTIGNTEPVLTGATLSPDPAHAGDVLTCSPGAASDADGDAVNLSWAWEVNGAAVAVTADTLDSSWWARGDRVRCTITPDDGAVAGVPMSDSLTISNTAPDLADVEITPDVPQAGDALTCTATGFADADGDADQSVYEWTVNGVAAGSGGTLTGTYPGGSVIVCTVTPCDGTDCGAPVSDTVVTENTPPVLADVTLSPLNPAEADTLVCAPGATTDADGSGAFSYAFRWQVNGADIAATGSSLTGADFDKGDAIRCAVTPNDGTDDGAEVWSAEALAINTAPVATLAEISPATPSTDDTLSAVAAGTDIDGDAVAWRYAWYVNGSHVGGDTVTFGSNLSDSGDSVYVEVTPDDGTDTGAPLRSATVVIGNTGPVMTGVTLTPDPAFEGDTLTCAPAATDADGDPVTFTYAWFVNGSRIAGTNPTLPCVRFDRGDSVYCRATPSDGMSSGAAMDSNTVTVQNTAPVASSVDLTPLSASESSTLTCTPTASDTDGDAISWSYAWYVNSALISQTTSTLTGTYFNSGNTVYCRATPTDGTSAGTALSSNTVTIGNTAPTLSSVTLTPATAYESSTLTCAATGSDADGTALSYSYRWYVNSALIAPTTATLTGTYFSKGNTVYCQATASDGAASSAAMASSTVTIANTAPIVSSVALTPTTASESSTLTCTPTGSDADGTTLSYTYNWYVNGVLIAPTTSTLTGTYFSRGNTVYCQATASDGSATSSAVASNTVTIQNSAPVASSVSLTPTTAYESSTLTCTPTSTDADGDAVSHTYAWYVNSSLIAPTTSTLTGTYFSRGNTVYCRATPTDGTNAGTAVSSNTVTISNTAPVTSSVALTPTTVYESTTLTCTPTSTDADGDAVSHTYAWYVNSFLIAPTTSTLTGTYFSSGNTVYCRATPTDGTNAGTAVSSNTVTVANTAPVVSSVALTPTTAYESSTLTCTPTSTDADGDAVSHTYAWYVNSSLIAPTTSTLTGTYFSRGNTVYCRATPTDGTNAGTAVSSNTVTISNTAPTAPVVDITPAAPVENVDNLVCGITTASTDADGDAISYTITWTADGASYPSAVAGASGPITTTRTNDTVPATDTDLATTWVCTVTPADSSGSGAAGTDSVTVTPSATPCSGGTLEVGWLPGWGGTYTSSSLTWANIEANALPYGTCSINITNTGGSFTLATLMAYDVLIIGDPSGYSIQYTAGELAAINSYLTGGYGGAVATYLMKFVTYDNSSLKSLFGVSSASLTNTNTAITTGATVVMPSHPIVANVPTSFTLLGFSYEQGVTGGWSSVALDATADFVVQGAGQSTVIANDTGTYRTVYFTTMADYNTPNNDTRQMLYDSLIWAAGY